MSNSCKISYKTPTVNDRSEITHTSKKAYMFLSMTGDGSGETETIPTDSTFPSSTMLTFTDNSINISNSETINFINVDTNGNKVNNGGSTRFVLNGTGQYQLSLHLTSSTNVTGAVTALIQMIDNVNVDGTGGNDGDILGIIRSYENNSLLMLGGSCIFNVDRSVVAIRIVLLSSNTLPVTILKDSSPLGKPTIGIVKLN